MKSELSGSAMILLIMLALLASATLLAGCVAVPTSVPASTPTSLPAPTARPSPNPAPLPTNEQDCLKQGGTWGPQGKAQQNLCDLPTTDAGQVCTDTSECEGTCFAVQSGSGGTCSPRRVNFGCHTVMKDGAPMGLCVD